MTFLEPMMLWGLLLGLLPILIHLFNRLRHRKLPWAAMMFLRMANRKSTKYAKVRQWLVLLFRMLAVMALVFAISRPAAGGFLKGMISGKPDVILIIVDRSASMGASQGEKTRLERAVEVIMDSSKKFGDEVRYVVMEHTDKRPREVKGGVSALPDVISKEVTDTAADIPTLLESAVEWFAETKPGIGEIWVASDLQSSNWDPAAEKRWRQLSGKIEGLPQSVGVRLMALDEEMPTNVSVRLLEAGRQRTADQVELVLKLEFTRGSALPVELDLAIQIEGQEKSATVSMEGVTHEHELRFPLRKDAQSGWGRVELLDQEDGNARDNVVYFVYGEPIQAQTAVVGVPDRFETRFLDLAAAPDPANTNQVSTVIAPTAVSQQTWTDYAMVLWQAPLPTGEEADRLTDYAKAGGLVICFPEEASDNNTFNGLSWGELKRFEQDAKTFDNWQALVAAEEEQEHLGFRITSYSDSEGPLQRTEEGLYLPVDDLRVNQRKAIQGDGLVQASFEDGVPWLMAKTVGKGQVIFCGTQPTDEWSSVTEGLVLVPMLQRLLTEGEAMLSGRYVQGHLRVAGDDRAGEGERWVSEESGENTAKDFNLEAGVYRMGQRVVAVNRPQREDVLISMDQEEVEALFGEVPLVLFQESTIEIESDDDRELWKAFLVVMALALLIEGILILPKGADERVEIQRSATGKVSTQQAI